MKNSIEKPSDILEDFLQKGLISTDIEKANLGDKKVKNGQEYEYVQIPSGAKDWRKVKEKSNDEADSDIKMTPAEKLKHHLKQKDDKALLAFAQKSTNNPGLRHAAVNELTSRGVDTSHIDLTNGKTALGKELFEDDKDSEKETKTSATAKETKDEGHLNTEYHKWDDKIANQWGNKVKPEAGETFDDPKFIERKFSKGWENNKNKRIDVDNYIDTMKRIQPDYQSPQQQVLGMNKIYAQFFSTKTPFAIISGDAGVGKTFNLHAVAKYYGQKPFDPNKDDITDKDYDYVEVGEVRSVAQMLNTLFKFKDKTIVFDDVDAVLDTPDIAGLLKKATAGSGKRIIGSSSTAQSSVPANFEFTGKILVLTNKSEKELVKNSDTKAIYSRASKFDVNMTKKEKLEMIDKLKYKMQFDAIEPLENAAENKKERDDVYKIMEDNIEKIDPKTFTARAFQEALGTKRAIDLTNEAAEKDPEAKELFGESEEWEPKVKKMLLKAEGSISENTIEKALGVLGLNNSLEKAKKEEQDEEELEKDMSAGSETGTDTTNKETSGASLKKESLFGKKKDKK